MSELTPYNKRENGIDRRPNDFFNLVNYFESFFNDSFFPSFFSNNINMKVDIKENEREYIVYADLPGVNKEQINVDVKYDTLTISIESRDEIREERENFVRRERRYGSTTRSFFVENVNEEGVKAKYDNGVLTITLPKKDTKISKSSRISIE